MFESYFAMQAFFWQGICETYGLLLFVIYDKCFQKAITKIRSVIAESHEMVVNCSCCLLFETCLGSSCAAF